MKKIISLEEFFLSKLGSISLDSKNPGNIVVKDLDDFVVMYNNKENGYLAVDYNSIWSVFEKKYRLQPYEIESFITMLILKHLKWRISKPIGRGGPYTVLMMKHLNWRLETPKMIIA
jgi:hypothetical protein